MEAHFFFLCSSFVLYKTVAYFTIWTITYCYLLIPLNHIPQENTETLGATSSMQDVL